MDVVSLTPAAAARVKELQRASVGYDYLRVAVQRGGSTGFMYDLKLDNRVDGDADYLGESNGIQVVVDHTSMLFLKGASIDWQVTPNGAGFRFDNPNAVQQ